VGAGVGAGGAVVEAADFAGGERVEELLAGVVEGLELEDFAAEIAEFGEPGAEVEGQGGVELFAQALGERGRLAGGGDGELKIAATDDGREVEVAKGWVVDCVAEDGFAGGFEVDGAVDGGDVGGGDDEEGAGGDVAFGKGALMPEDFTGLREFGDCGRGFGGDDRDRGFGGAERFDFRLGEVAGADDEAGAGGELEEDGEEGHKSGKW